MNNFTVKISVFIIMLIALSCSNESEELSEENTYIEELQNEFYLYPLAVNPEFINVSEVVLNDNEIVGIVDVNGIKKVYPYAHVFQKEVINDVFGTNNVVFSYCPITKSAVCFYSDVKYRASGQLLRDNLVLWDEATESLWSQMLLKSINGNDRKFSLIPITITNWSTIKQDFSNLKVLKKYATENEKTYVSNRTEDLPLGNDTSNSVNAPSEGENAYGIITNSKVSIYKYADFSNKKLIKKTMVGVDYIVYGNFSKGLITSFIVDNNNDYIELPASDFPFIFKDQRGFTYDIYGASYNGGGRLEKTKNAYVASWWSWKNFYNNFSFVDEE